MHSSVSQCRRHLCLDARSEESRYFMKYFVRQVSAATLCIATYLGTYLGTLAGPGLSSALAEDSCKFTDICSGTAAGIRDGRTVLLADGRELRLAGVEVTES